MCAMMAKILFEMDLSSLVHKGSVNEPSFKIFLSASLTLGCFFRLPDKVLKPEDFDRGNRGPWRPQLGFNPNRQQAHLDQSGFRALR